MSYETILVSRSERVGTITLNRPEALNALNSLVMVEVTGAAAELDADPGIGAIIITGSAKAFAAGADIDGVLVGGASLDGAGFEAICRAFAA